jgi:hypothetical protein
MILFICSFHLLFPLPEVTASASLYMCEIIQQIFIGVYCKLSSVFTGTKGKFVGKKSQILLYK